MGDFEIILIVISVSILAIVVYNIITALTFNDLVSSFGLLNLTSRDFYECGFNPQTQNPIKVSLQFLVICVFFLLYDIELVFLFPFVSSYSYSGFYDALLISLFFAVFFLSLNVDYERHALLWQE